MASYTPFAEIDRMFADLDRRFDEMRRTLRSAAGPIEEPMGGPIENPVRLDVHREDDGYVVMADLPGFEREDLSLRVEGGVLHLDAERTVEEERSARRRRVHERVTLPEAVVPEEATATYRNGVLEVHLPAEESPDAGHAIEIRD